LLPVVICTFKGFTGCAKIPRRLRTLVANIRAEFERQPNQEPFLKNPKEDAMFKRFHGRKGFTLIELMIVVVIIGILAALAIPRFMQATTKSKQSEAKQLLKQIYTMQRAYRQEQGAYAHGGEVVTAGGRFDLIGVEIQAEAKYTYTMAAALNTFSCTATANLDDDGAIDTWTINQDGALVCDIDDVVEI
jgi:prepilin-type N-terminal cleavage/methylation domain-containing protein